MTQTVSILGLGSGGQDLGPTFLEFRHHAMLNGGYLIYAKLHDPYFNLLNTVINADNTYLQNMRNSPIQLTTKLAWNPDPGDGSILTQQPVTSYLAALHANCLDKGNHSYVEFIGID